MLTADGITKLKRLTGNFHETAVLVHVLDTREWRTGLSTDVSDGFRSIRALFVEEGGRVPAFSICKIKQALFCPGYVPPEEEYDCPPQTCGVIVIRKYQLVEVDPTPLIVDLVPDFHPTKIKANPIPIAALPYVAPNYELDVKEANMPPIRVFVTYKSRLSDPRYLRCSSCLPYFILHLLDDSEEVRAYVNGEIALELYDRFQAGRTYYVSGVLSGRRGDDCNFFYNLRSRYNIKLTAWSIVEESPHFTGSLQYRFQFIPISRLNNISLSINAGYFGRGRRLNNCVDVIGIVQDVSLLDSTIETKIPCRGVTIFDQSGIILVVNLWSYNAEEFTGHEGDIVAFRNAHLTECLFEAGGDMRRVLSVVTPSTVHVEPKIEEAFVLRQWYNCQPVQARHSHSSMNMGDVMLCERDDSYGETESIY